jgi:hypothetical protein
VTYSVTRQRRSEPKIPISERVARPESGQIQHRVAFGMRWTQVTHRDLAPVDRQRQRVGERAIWKSGLTLPSTNSPNATSTNGFSSVRAVRYALLYPLGGPDAEIVSGDFATGVYSVTYLDAERKVVACLSIGGAADLDAARERIVSGEPVPA